ncbi:MAG TPA: cysteine peptidase family C39 domain-containing protein [Polyangiales bacterium]|nr:cysteine peptidase family C39 domain-containing protein [Polyangiales bacterium]
MRLLPRLRVRVTPVQQLESAECGVACLTMVASYFGCWAPLAEVRQICGTSRDGNSALTLVQGARTLGMTARGLKIQLDQLHTLKRPAILHWDLNHFVVLEAVHKRGATIVDPATGRRFVSSEQLDRSLTGVVLEMKPGPGFRRRKRRSLSYERYRAALMSSKGTLLYVLLGNLTSQILALTFPASSQFFIDHVISPGRKEWILPVLCVMLLGGVGQVTLAALQRKSQAMLHAALGFKLTTELGRRLLTLPLPFLDSRSKGDLINRVQLQDALQALIARAAQGVFDLLLLSLLCALMLAYHQELGLLAISLMVVRVFVIRRVRAVAEHNFGAELAARGRAQAAFMEATASPEMIKGLGLEAHVWARYEQRTIDRAGFTIRSQLLEKRLQAGLSVLSGLMEACVLWYGGQFVIRGEMSVGVFAGFLAIRQLLDAPLNALVGLFESLFELRGAFERSDEVFNVEPDKFGDRDASYISGAFELRDVGFRYGSGGSWTLRHVNLRIEPGEQVVIVGASGQGKSTLAKLLCGVLRPTEGEVLLDGVPVTSYASDSLALQLGVVLQEPLILAGSVEDAVRMRLPQANRSMIVRALQLALFQPVLARMPAGTASPVALGGTNLAGGERQRLALAQALVGDPRVLLLDEATSALDPATEAHILDNLSSLRATVISIAHKQSVISRARRVITVAAGGVRDQLVTPLPPAARAPLEPLASAPNLRSS